MRISTTTLHLEPMLSPSSPNAAQPQPPPTSSHRRQFELLSGSHNRATPHPFDRQLCDAFRVLDKDATSFLSISELRHIITIIGKKLDPSKFDDWSERDRDVREGMSG
ncbi:hypothetical protein M0R45_008230 [Rubus argutus]|uniref:EF-hand domain-containing protein n=1 Tax=Rubus argutus TaxID=59490 RepID=A0AAW1Y0T9_RUBAR